MCIKCVYVMRYDVGGSMETAQQQQQQQQQSYARLVAVVRPHFLHPFPFL